MFVPRNVIFLLAGCLALTGFSVLAQAQVAGRQRGVASRRNPDVLQMAGRAIGPPSLAGRLYSPRFDSEPS